MDRYYRIFSEFDIDDKAVGIQKWGYGHINRTFLVDTAKGDQYIMQMINKYVFTEPDKVMHNIMKVTEYLKRQIEEEGGDPERETLNVIMTRDGKNLYWDEDGEPWRVYTFVKNSISYERVRSNEDFYYAGSAFGNFAKRLIDFPADELYETIPKFHDMPDRYHNFDVAIEEDRSGRAKNAAREIELAQSFRQYAWEFFEREQKGELFNRVTHNDTKPNNILYDRDTNRPICIVDLDTVMPGLIANDFANSIRFGANKVAEDAKNYEDAGIDLELYRLYTKGYLDECGSVLTDVEKEMLPVGARMMSIENGIRFLGDYLDGDVYFSTEYPEHNLVRARTQLKLVEDMLKNWDQMEDILHELI